MINRRRGLLAATIAISLVATACGGDDDATDSSATTTVAEESAEPSAEETAEPTAEPSAEESTEPTAEETAEPTAEETAAPMGEPLVLSVIAQGSGPVAQPEIYDGADAAAAAINAAGGVTLPDGSVSPIEILACDGASSTDPNAPLNCAREAVEAGALATVTKYSSGDDIYTELEPAGIPVIGEIALSPGDFTNPLSFPLHPGSAGIAAGLGALAQSQGHTTVALITNDLPSGRVIPDFVKPFLADPADLVAEIYLPLDPSADISSLIAQATGADAVLSVNSAGGNVRAINALNQAGYTGAIAVAGLTVNEEMIDQIGDAADRLIIAGGWDAIASSDSALVADFLADMAEYAPDAVVSEYSLNAWLTVHFVADVLAETGPDSAAIIAALDGRTVDYDIAPSFSLGGGPANPLGLSRIFRMTIQPQQVVDGQVVAIGDGEFLDLNAG
jgi:ABC-type branched-subunit amino acid transport system substrate-binding protein